MIDVDSWDAIESRPGFVTNLDPSLHKLASIIGRYLLRDKIPCGLSNCRTPHAKGYIVVTKDGCETNIGKDCGKTYFGVDFETLSRKFDRDITMKENREKLWSFSFNMDEVVSKVELRASGADQVYLSTRPLVTPSKGCPVEVIRRIGEMIKTRTNVLSEARQATAQEIEDQEAREGRRLSGPQYREIRIAEIDGLSTLYPENNLRDILVLDLEAKLQRFRETDLDTLTPEELKQWVKWISTVEPSIERAEAIIGAGRRLLKKENLRPFLTILTDEHDVTQFREYLNAIEVSKW